MARIFISSTTDDLKDHRAAVVMALRSLGHEPLVMEDMSASALTPLEQSRAAIDTCDVYIGIVGWRYGFVPPKDNPGAYSFVELEYRHARDRDLPTLVFVASDEASWPKRFIDTGAQAEGLERFRAELLKQITVRFFTSPDDLAQKVLADVTTVLARKTGQAGHGGLGGPPPPPLPPGIDPFELAWRLVVDFKADPALLRHMDLGQLYAAVGKWKSEAAGHTDAGPSPLYQVALEQLRGKQADLSPNALWLAWMRATRTLPPGLASRPDHVPNQGRDGDSEKDQAPQA